VALTFIAWVIVIIIAQALDPNFERSSSDTANVAVAVWGFATFAAWAAVGMGRFIGWLRKTRARRSTAMIDETIREAVGGPTETRLETVRQRVEKSLGAASDRLFEQRERRLAVERLVSEGASELDLYLPKLPRSVKRVANRHYLLASVAVSRNMIGGTPPLTAQHLGKWAVMMERWPELARKIIEDPSLAGRLERWARADGHPVDRPPLPELPSVDRQEDLIQLLSDQTSLDAVAQRLVLALPARL
jgi:hypothetical protein